MRRATPTLVLATALVACAATVTAQDRAYRIMGQVVDTSGVPAVGVRVCAYPIERGPAFGASCTRSGNEGSFALDTRAGGRHQVMADDPDGGHLSQRRLFYRAPGLPVVDVVLDDGAPSATVTVVLAPKNGTLVVRAADDETGWPVDLLRIVLCHAADPQLCFVSDERRDDGVYTLAAPHVPFLLDAFTPEHERWRGATRGELGSPLTIASGETLETTLRLSRKPAFRGVALTDQEKQPGVHLPAPIQTAPLPGAQLSAFPRTTLLEWQAVPGAASYTVEVDFCNGRSPTRECTDPYPLHRDPPMAGITATSYTFTFIGAQPGRWRVFAVDSLGRPGFKSPWRVFVHER
ncbi:MAG: carboxypeptidase regulatory-like domain-containing protein [Acidobacteria bacterium]|nr:carboxypeptidase regulatory-like domain-containing protein [Acidobacteriota bacterium]